MADFRHDMGAPLRSVRTHPAGFLLVDARPTRAGVFQYRRADGSIRREYRPPEEVFKASSLETLRGASVTDLHPPEGNVTPSNFTKLEVGTVTEAHEDGLFVASELVVKRADAIDAVRKRERVELSCGYTCRYDPMPGVTPEGERYDGIQRNIQYNHVALLPKGTARGGAECALRLDSDDAVMVDESYDELRVELRADAGESSMRKIVIKGVGFDAPEQTAQAFEQALQEEKARADSLAAELDKTKGRLDAVTADLETVRKDATDPAKFQAAVKARVALEGAALQVLGKEVKTDGLSDLELQKKVITHVHKDAQLEGKSADYVAARFDSVMETWKPSAEADERREGRHAERAKVDPPRRRQDAGDGEESTDQGERTVRTDADFRKRLGTAYRENLAVTR